MQEWIDDIQFERFSLGKKLAKKLVLNPLANYLPASWFRKWLAEGDSELALSNWKDPGGWRSMVISYEGNPENTWDRILVNSGTIPTALRNRRKLAARMLARLLEQSKHQPAHALCLGAGPGHIISDAMLEAKSDCHATLVDISSDAFDYGRALAEDKQLSGRMKFVHADVRDVELDERVDVVKMIGICEYIEDEQLIGIAHALQKLMPNGAAMVFNSISTSHGTDRFFRRVFGLHMIHHTPEQLQALFSEAGFGEYTTFDEPLGVYHVCIARMMHSKAELEPTHV